MCSSSRCLYLSICHLCKRPAHERQAHEQLPMRKHAAGKKRKINHHDLLPRGVPQVLPRVIGRVPAHGFVFLWSLPHVSRACRPLLLMRNPVEQQPSLSSREPRTSNNRCSGSNNGCSESSDRITVTRDAITRNYLLRRALSRNCHGGSGPHVRTPAGAAAGR
jgi:hypothetical protein